MYVFLGIFLFMYKKEIPLDKFMKWKQINLNTLDVSNLKCKKTLGSPDKILKSKVNL